jgi:high-affinity iron transporter
MLFSFPLFIVLLRESLEISLISFILISFIDKLPQLSSYKPLVYQGIIIGSLSITLVGLVFVQIIKYFEITTQDLWEVLMGLVSGIVIIITGLGFIKSMAIYKKLEQNFTTTFTSVQDLVVEETTPLLEPTIQVEKNMFFYIPLITVLREGMESILLISGVTASVPLRTIPISALLGITTGTLISYILHKLSHKLQLQSLFISGGFIMVMMGIGIVSRSVGKYGYA